MIFTCVGDIWRYDGWYVCCSVDLFAVRLKYTIMYTYFHVSLNLQLKHQAVWALLPSHHMYRIQLNGYIHPQAISLSHLRLWELDHLEVPEQALHRMDITMSNWSCLCNLHVLDTTMSLMYNRHMGCLYKIGRLSFILASPFTCVRWLSKILFTGDRVTWLYILFWHDKLLSFLYLFQYL